MRKQRQSFFTFVLLWLATCFPFINASFEVGFTSPTTADTWSTGTNETAVIGSVIGSPPGAASWVLQYVNCDHSHTYFLERYGLFETGVFEVNFTIKSDFGFLHCDGGGDGYRLAIVDEFNATFTTSPLFQMQGPDGKKNEN